MGRHCRSYVPPLGSAHTSLPPLSPLAAWLARAPPSCLVLKAETRARDQCALTGQRHTVAKAALALPSWTDHAARVHNATTRPSRGINERRNPQGAMRWGQCVRQERHVSPPARPHQRGGCLHARARSRHSGAWLIQQRTERFVNTQRSGMTSHGTD